VDDWKMAIGFPLFIRKSCKTLTVIFNTENTAMPV
jgi:hypothetical protein